VAAGLSVLLLLLAGHRGKQQAELQARLGELHRARHQLQEALDAGPTPAGQPVSGLANEVRAVLGQFTAGRTTSRLPSTAELELRLGRATLALAEQRFAESLTALTEADELRPHLEAGQLALVLQVRGAAFYGLGKWPEALDRYQKLLAHQPDDPVALARLAGCHRALGQVAEARTASARLAKHHHSRGDALFAQGKLAAALEHYDTGISLLNQLPGGEASGAELDLLARACNSRGNLLLIQGKPEAAVEVYGKALAFGTARGEAVREQAARHHNLGNALVLQGKLEAALVQHEQAIAIQSQLAGQAAGGDLAGALAESHVHCGNIQLSLGKPAAALAHYETANRILVPLVEQQDQGELAGWLALSHGSLGHTLLALARTDAAASHYDQAIAIHTRLNPGGGRGEALDQLALCRNNRGAILRAQGKPEAALKDFEAAIRSLSQPGQGEAVSLTDRGAVTERTHLALDVAIGYSGKSFEVLARDRLAHPSVPGNRPVILAMLLRNRAQVRLAQAGPAAALEDYQSSLEILGKLVEQEGQLDLAPQYAQSLTLPAWLYATHPNALVRDGGKARAYGMKACELTNWKALGPLETLAAACAETGAYKEALKWQEMALALAPDAQKPEHQARLELFKSAKTLRTLPR